MFKASEPEISDLWQFKKSEISHSIYFLEFTFLWLQVLHTLCCCSVAKSCPTLYDPMDCSMPGFSVLHYLPEFVQTHVHWVRDAIQASHLLLPPSPPSIFPSIRDFKNGSALCLRWPKYWSFSLSISPSNDYSELISFELTGWISLQSKGFSRAFSSTTIWKHQFFDTQPLSGPAVASLHDYWKDHSFDCISSVQFSCSVMFDSLRPHELQHARPPCPLPTPRVHPNSCPLSRWCHPAILFSVVPFSSCLQFLPASESFPMIQLFT